MTRPAKNQACPGKRVLTGSLGDPIMAISLSSTYDETTERSRHRSIQAEQKIFSATADLHSFAIVRDSSTHGKLRVLAWLRRIVVSFGVGGMSYALMLAFLVASVAYDRELEPVVTLAFETGRQITDLLESWVSGNYWGQVAVNHLRERVNMTHVVLSIPAIVIAVLLVGIPLNRFLGGTRSSLQRLAIALVSIPATLLLAVTLFTFNALVPETYAALLRFADSIWQLSLNGLSAWGDTVPGARKLTNVARQGFSGHHFVIMALCSTVAAFLVNALFASGRKK